MQEMMIHQLPDAEVRALVNKFAKSLFAADTMDSSALQYQTVKVSYELLADALSQYGAVADTILKFASLYKLKGYYSAVDPSTVSHIVLRVDDLWWQGSGSEIPDTFPAICGPT